MRPGGPPQGRGVVRLGSQDRSRIAPVSPGPGGFVTMTGGPHRYLLVTHIPFVRQGPGEVKVDGLWARDLQGLVKSFGQIRVAAPELPAAGTLRTWGPTAANLRSEDGIT